jgi:glycine dehydrogenase subunit 1
MPFIPHTPEDKQAMLLALGLSSTQSLFDEIPKALQVTEIKKFPAASSEIALAREMPTRAQKDECALNFIGAGAYEHHIPACVWEVALRGEWMSAYTPYQAEASQGTLQMLYEYQTLMSRLMALEATNASMYDGATSLAEAILMAARCHKRSKEKIILMPATVDPAYRSVVKTLTNRLGLRIIELPFCSESGRIIPEILMPFSKKNITALVIPQPNFFGVLEDSNALAQWAKENQVITIAVVNPIAMGWLQPPGEWAETGVDIACGSGQPLGIPLFSGGAHFGFLACQKKYIRQLPGRLVGRTIDLDGNPGFTLTLQAREQHIRRAKATSNICTNQGLMVLAATIYMSLMGEKGLINIARRSHQQAVYLKKQLLTIPGVEILFSDEAFFHEIVCRLPVPIKQIQEKLLATGIEGGWQLSKHYTELENTLLICTTEKKTQQDCDYFVQQLSLACQAGA